MTSKPLNWPAFHSVCHATHSRIVQLGTANNAVFNQPSMFYEQSFRVLEASASSCPPELFVEWVAFYRKTVQHLTNTSQASSLAEKKVFWDALVLDVPFVPSAACNVIICFLPINR